MHTPRHLLALSVAFSFAAVAACTSETEPASDSDVAADAGPDLAVEDVLDAETDLVGSDVSEPDAADTPRDLEPEDATPDVVADAPADLPQETSSDATEDSEFDVPETDVGPAEISLGEWVTLGLAGAESAEGEVIAIYDHSAWWTSPSDEITYALFDESRFAPYPDDRSVRLVRASEVFSVESEPLGGRRSYWLALRDLGIVIDQPPLDGRFYVITGNDTYHLEENGFGDYAWDLVRTAAGGLTYRGAGFSNEDYFVWEAPIVLPTAGIVVERQDSAPDNVPGFAAPVDESSSCGSNNCIGVHLGGSFYLYLLHLRQGSIPDAIEVGDELPAGAPVGQVGNSGVSIAPHLHMTLLWFDEDADPPRSWSVPAEMRNIWSSREPTDAVEAEYVNPTAGTWLSSEPF